MDLPRLIEALSSPAAYPYPVAAVETRQTHISVVFLAGAFVYKVKKPVNPGFLDFSTLEKRHHFCDEEVRLNRRLAPSVYLGVVPVTAGGDGPRFEGDGPAVEWAVKMRRLPEGATLQKRLERGEVGPELAETLAGRIAAFHRAAESGEHIAANGRFEAVAAVLRDIFVRAAPAVGTTVSRTVFERVQALTEQELARHHDLIGVRASRGVPRDCHGDLHLDHVYFFPERQPPDDLVVIDCIEFNEHFRFIDPVGDMAFAAMDFAFHGRRDLARAFAEAYFRASGDDEGRALLPLYTAHRAAVRGAVEGLLLAEAEVPAAERAAALRRARGHWLLALAELEEPGRRPCLVLVGGLPGTGKSELARGLAGRAGFHVLRSDVVRKELAGGDASGRLPESHYSAEWNERTYARCLRRAREYLFEGERVVVDATFREERYRQAFLRAAVRWGVPAALLLCKATPETVRKRLEARHGDASDADWAVYQRAAASWEEMTPDTRRLSHAVSTEGTPEAAQARALEALRQLGLAADGARGTA
jgi:aminoglycoside phosphotransferase family enzyme/predicted kinase